MADEETTDGAALAVVARHALHDEELVAALATGSLDEETQIARARSFVERCSACRALHDDIEAIGASLKLEATGTIAAPKDYRLTVEDARRLGGPLPVGSIVVSLRRAIASFGRPVGASMAALGIVGLLVGSVSLGAGSVRGPVAAGSGADTATSAPEIDSQPQAIGPKSSDRNALPASSAEFAASTRNEPATDAASASANPAVWLLGGSGLLLVAGIGLLVVAIRRNP